jgi:hypothetical protein
MKCLDLSRTKTYSVKERYNLVTIENMAQPDRDVVMDRKDPEMEELVDRIVEARLKGCPVVLFMGAHVIKCGGRIFFFWRCPLLRRIPSIIREKQSHCLRSYDTIH